MKLKTPGLGARITNSQISFTQEKCAGLWALNPMTRHRCTRSRFGLRRSNDACMVTHEAAGPLRGAAGASVSLFVPLANKQHVHASHELHGRQSAVKAVQQNFDDTYLCHIAISMSTLVSPYWKNIQVVLGIRTLGGVRSNGLQTSKLKIRRVARYFVAPRAAAPLTRTVRGDAQATSHIRCNIANPP